jgi:hypothetical protein
MSKQEERGRDIFDDTLSAKHVCRGGTGGYYCTVQETGGRRANVFLSLPAARARHIVVMQKNTLHVAVDNIEALH